MKSFLRGFVYFDKNPSAVECVVREISESEARLEFATLPTLTDLLVLYIPIKGQSFHAKLRSTVGGEIGVEFYDPLAAEISPPIDNVELPMRMKRLEVELGALKQLVKCLQKKTDRSKSDAA